MRFSKKSLEGAKLPGKYERISLQAFMAWLHFTFPSREALKVYSYRTHGDPIFYSAIPNQDRQKRENEAALYKSTGTVLVEQMEILSMVVTGCCR